MIRELARTAVRQTLAHRRPPPYVSNDRHVWLIRPDHLGDLLFLRPGLKRFREQMPDWHITLMIGPWSRAVVENDPNVDEIVEFPFPGFTRAASNNLAEPYRRVFDAAALIRTQRPQAVVILRDDHWWGALAAHRAGVPSIVGSERSELHGLLTDAIEVAGLHSVQRNARFLDFAARRLGSTITQPSINPIDDPIYWDVTEDDRAGAGALLERAGVDRPFAVIHPGSGAPVKLWPAERWADVASSLGHFGIAVVLTGSASETPYLERIASLTATPISCLGGQTSLAELGAVFERSLAVVGVDSGPLHLAVAIDNPTMQIYGPSDVGTYGPWGDPTRHLVICSAMTCPDCGNLALGRPAGTGCMVAIHAEDVSAAVFQLLRE